MRQCRMSALGQKRTNLRRPKSIFVRYCPKAEKMLRCVRLLKGEKLLGYGNSAHGSRSLCRTYTVQGHKVPDNGARWCNRIMRQSQSMR